MRLSSRPHPLPIIFLTFATILLIPAPAPAGDGKGTELAGFALAWDGLADRVRRVSAARPVPGREAADRLARAARCLEGGRDDVLRRLSGEVLAAARALGAEPVEGLELTLALRDELPGLVPEPPGTGAGTPCRGDGQAASPGAVLATLRDGLLGPRDEAPR